MSQPELGQPGGEVPPGELGYVLGEHAGSSASTAHRRHGPRPEIGRDCGGLVADDEPHDSPTVAPSTALTGQTAPTPLSLPPRTCRQDLLTCVDLGQPKPLQAVFRRAGHLPPLRGGNRRQRRQPLPEPAQVGRRSTFCTPEAEWCTPRARGGPAAAGPRGWAGRPSPPESPTPPRGASRSAATRPSVLGQQRGQTVLLGLVRPPVVPGQGHAGGRQAAGTRCQRFNCSRHKQPEQAVTRRAGDGL